MGQIVKLPNLLAFDEPITAIKSDFPMCKTYCGHYKEKHNCEGCNNYEFNIFWKSGKNWEGIRR